CETTAKFPGEFDVGISTISQFGDPGDVEEIRNSGFLRDSVPSVQFDRYKYHIDIDGNTNSWPGLFIKLLTGSPVLKVASPFGFRQWYYDKLKPWINYIPVAADMSDLADKVRWLRANDEAARRIGEGGRQLADSLECGNELKRAARTISSAIRHFSRLPEIALSFGDGQEDNIYLKDGWAAPESNGVPAQGFDSRIELSAPITADDFVLTLDLSPYDADALPFTQRISIASNGETLLQTSVSGRRQLQCFLPRQTIDLSESLSICLLHPDARVAASATRPADDRVLSTVLHGLSLTPAATYASGVSPAQVTVAPSLLPSLRRSANYELRTVEMPNLTTALQDLDKVEANTGIGLLRTHLRTIVFLHSATGELRHGNPAMVPRNVFIVVRDGRALLVHVALNGNCYEIRILSSAADGNPGTSEAAVQMFEVDGGKEFGLRCCGLFLCGETDGRITASRPALGPWERFSIVPPSEVIASARSREAIHRPPPVL
ncbi:MAG: glycosyl transferase family 90, partial [Candidatus Acidiferrum sp.]